MKPTHPALWGAGLAGLFVGATLAATGISSTADSAQLAGGYGLMLMGAATYLLGGLGLRQTLARRSASSAATDRRSAAPPAGVSSADNP